MSYCTICWLVCNTSAPIGTIWHLSTSLCQTFLLAWKSLPAPIPPVSVALLPIITMPHFALLMTTFSLRISARNPMSHDTLHRTVTKITMSASRPWKPSMEDTSMFVIAPLSASFCRVYGVKIATDDRCSSEDREAASDAQHACKVQLGLDWFLIADRSLLGCHTQPRSAGCLSAKETATLAVVDCRP
jgi:hypothetical protein